MSITNDVRATEPRPNDGHGGEPRGTGRTGGDGQFDRTPPQDVAAEQCALGGMLLSKDAIADVVEILRTADFYRPNHGAIFDAILDLYGRGEPADAITVAAALAGSGDLARVGGAAYLHTLIATVPTAANAAYYAKIVSERAVLRRLIEAGTRIVQLGYGAAGGGGRDTDDLVDLAQQTVYDVTERRVSEDFAVLAEMLQPTLDEIEAVGAQGGVMTGVPTGFTDLDRLLNGLHAGQLVIVAGRPGLGKALALDTPLPTRCGWTTMAEVTIGDQLIGADGRPTTVTMTTEVMHGRPCYEVEFSDGTVIVADADHQWVTWDQLTRRTYDRQRTADAPPYPENWATWSPAGESAACDSVKVEPVTTARIAATLRADGSSNHAVPAAAPLRYPTVDLPVDPYVLGYLLGVGDADGNGRAACAPQDREWLTKEFDRLGYAMTECPDSGQVRVAGIRARWRSLGLTAGRFIPEPYLYSSIEQRTALVQGLVDADGYIDGQGSYRFSNSNPALVEGFRQLVTSLGCVPRVHHRAGRARAGKVSAESWEVIVPTPRCLARIPRKVTRARSTWGREQTSRYVIDVRPVESVPVRCVQVDNDDHLYLAGRSMVPTHNSTAAMDFTRAASVKHNMASAIFSLEMSKVEIVMRLLAAESRVPLHVLRSGQLSDDDWTKLARRMGEISEAPLFVDDTPNMTLMEIRTKARRLKQRHDLKLIVVDYLQLMTSPKRVESRQQEVAELSRGLKLLAKEVECPVVAVSQLNRGPEQRTDKRPQLSDLRESGCLTAETRIVRADTNTEVTLGALLAEGAHDVPVWALDERLKYVPRIMTHVFPSGRKQVFRLRLASGKEVEATANHPFLTVDGWRSLGELQTGARVGVPRHIPPPQKVIHWVDDKVVMLAHLLGGGSFVRRQPIRYCSRDEECLTAVTSAARHFGIAPILDGYESARATTLRLSAPYRLARGQGNPIAEWLDGMGLFGLRSHEKFVPASVFSLPKQQIALFLRHIWATDGSVTLTAGERGGRVCFGSTSRRLVDDLSMLLLRFGISTRLRVVRPEQYRTQYTLDISEREDQLRFLREIGAHGTRAEACTRLMGALESIQGTPNVDTIPKEVWSRVRAILLERGIRHPELAVSIGTQLRGSTSWQRASSRQRLARIAGVLEAADLELLATNDVLWDEVVNIEPLGEQEVYDATVLGGHNFVANGIAVHNSIEQDADVVILLHRDDYYDKESPRAGEADFIVAKHRNGPTDTVTVAAQLHLSRFVDMAI